MPCRDGGFQGEDSFQQFGGRLSLSFTKQMEDYIKNSAVLKEAILKTFSAAVEEIIKSLNEEIASLQCEVN